MVTLLREQFFPKLESGFSESPKQGKPKILFDLPFRKLMLWWTTPLDMGCSPL
jgi:hypothetical protein